MLIYCFNKYVQCQYKHEWQIKVKKLHIFHCFYRFCLVVFIPICILQTALVLFDCISPEMCIAYALVLSSLVVFIYKLYKVLFMIVTIRCYPWSAGSWQVFHIVDLCVFSHQSVDYCILVAHLTSNTFEGHPERHGSRA